VSAGIYLTISMAVTSISVVLTVFVLKLHHCRPHQTEVPKWIRGFVLKYLARVVQCGANSNSNSTAGGTGSVKTKRSSRRQTSSLSHKVTDRLQTIDVAPLRRFQDNSHYRHYQVADFKILSERNQGRGDSLPPDALSPDTVSEPSQNARIHRPSNVHVGHVGQAGTPFLIDDYRLNVMDEILNYLKIVVSKKDEDERDGEIVNDWRQVAYVVDRFLFWCFFVITMTGTALIMMIIPLCRQQRE